MLRCADQEKFDSIAAHCKEIGARLTKKRSRIVGLLVDNDSALSAYDLIDLYAEAYPDEPCLLPMSVYRILDYLHEQKIVHKLESVNRYILCPHSVCEKSSCAHSHDQVQFLICDKCERVQELRMPKKVREELLLLFDGVGFSPSTTQFELKGRCSSCRD